MISCTGNEPDSPDETGIMAARLDSIAKHTNPLLNEFANRIRVDHLKRIPVLVSSSERFSYLGTLAKEMIYAGDTKDAINILESLLAHDQLLI